MRICLVCITVFFSSWQLFGQPIEIKNAKIEYELFKNAERLVFPLDQDPGIDEVLKMSWKPASALALDQKNTRSAYYLKTSIINHLEKELVCHVYYVSLSKLDIYQVVNNEVVKSANLGIYSNQIEFPLLHSSPILELTTETGQLVEIIIRVEGVQTGAIPWFISAYKPFIRIRHHQDLFYGLVYGLLLLVVVYNLSIYYRLRETDNLVYALWVFFQCFHLSFFNGFIYEFGWPNLVDGNNLVDVAAAIGGILHVTFAVTFLKIKWNRPAGKIAIFIILWYVVGALATILGYAEAFFPWLNPVVIVIVDGVFCIVCGAMAWFKGYKPALYFLLANVFLFIFIGLVISYGTGNTDHTLVAYNSYQIGIALEVIFFSFGLSFKVRLLKQQKDQALKEKTALILENEGILRNQNILLEQKVSERTKELQEEKSRSDALLLNILPEQTAIELKATGTARAKRHENVTIIFADFVGFTQISETLEPEALVERIDFYFRAFDNIIDSFGLEKIKTIGDAYMAVSNLPSKFSDSETRAVKAALAMQNFVKNSQVSDAAFTMRIGINTGAVVAGVVGSRKFQFDIWGDAVNIAARIEQNCEPGKVNVSASTYAAINHNFLCDSRGKIEAKNKGTLAMYYVLSEK